MWTSAIVSTIAGGVLTWLSVEYKKAYNSLVYDKNWNAIKETWTWELNIGSKVWSYVGLVLSAKEIGEQMDKLRKAQVAATAAQKPIRWVNPKIAIVLSAIDVLQSVISLHNS
ncbi:hypothetical protein [Mesomycoplasma ovipneumoniae]|uniref:hypothetical protein n=1 Tax=Mesomycoplasma ovipneumoniae TaxID=29562 RepID=UPI00069F033A|nr:hypothetical protein [Mesomycoplasma ovipneumoniae]